MTDPNDIQIGGDHYKGVKFQPWDWALYQLGYYETSAIAYIVRFRKKGGIQDLEKAQHYLDKMLAAALGDEYSNRCQADNLTVLDFNKQNGCDRWQSLAVHLLVQWRVRDELVEAKKAIEELIQCEKDERSDRHRQQIANLDPRARPPLIFPVPEPAAAAPDIRYQKNTDPRVPAHFVQGAGTGVIEPRPLPPKDEVLPPAPAFDLATAVLPPYKPLKSALKIPRVWNDDSDPDKLVNHD
jgi:hypothetical protein